VPRIPQPLLPDDDGGADVAVASALAALSAGTADASRVISVLGAARLLVPVVAVLVEAEVGEDGGTREKRSDMALPKLIGADGRVAVPAFTSLDSLKRWRADARPIQAATPQVCQAALHEDAAAVVIDVAGPVPFPVEGALLHALAALGAPPAEAAERLARGVPGVTVARLGPRPGRRFPWVRPRRRG
jgi:hypothetical protein